MTNKVKAVIMHNDAMFSSGCDQDRELAAMRDFYANSDKPCDRVRIAEAGEVFVTLEQTRLYGPFDADVLFWVGKVNAAVPGYVKIGQDSRGEYIQY